MGRRPRTTSDLSLWPTALGYILKISDMQAACALALRDRVEEFIAKRRANFAYLKARLQRCAELLHLPEATPNSEPSWVGFPLILKESSGVKRADLINFLEPTSPTSSKSSSA